MTLPSLFGRARVPASPRALPLVLLLAFVWGGCEHAPREAEHADGEGEHAEALTSPRIVSMAPSLTEILFALGLGDRVVGVTRYCDYPPEATMRTNVGGYVDPNMDALVALAPDVVVLLQEHQSLQKQLDVLEIAHLQTRNDMLSDVLATIDTLGRHFQVPKRSDSLLAHFRIRLDSVEAAGRRRMSARSAAGLPPRPRILISIGRNMGSGTVQDAYIAGDRTFYADLLRRAGAENAYTGGIEYPKLSAEGLIRLQPDYIFDMVPDLEKKGLGEGDVIAEWQGLPELKAVRENRVVVFPQDYSVIPGPRLVMLLEEMNRALQVAAP